MHLRVRNILAQHDARYDTTVIDLTTGGLLYTDMAIDVDCAHACVVG